MRVLILTPLVIVALATLSPDPASAQVASQFITCDGTDCSFCNVVDMGNAIIKWLIGILVTLTGVLLAIAGIRLVISAGDTSARESAKSMFTNALIGFLIVLSAWLIVDTLMRTLLPGDQGEITGYGPWQQVQCWEQERPVFVREGANPMVDYDGELADVLPPPTGAAGTLTQAEAEAMLAQYQISVVSSGSCTDRTVGTCTSLDGIQATTLSRIVELQQAVGAPIVVTGGTETGHAAGEYSHGTGYKIDLRTTPELNSYITANFTQIGSTKYQDPNGNVYYRHPPDHWDITITN